METLEVVWADVTLGVDPRRDKARCSMTWRPAPSLGVSYASDPGIATRGTRLSERSEGCTVTHRGHERWSVLDNYAPRIGLLRVIVAAAARGNSDGDID